MNTSKLPKISIITPSFNQGRFIEQTINSVLNQNYPKLEYWVIDGGSTDNTIQILKKYEAKLNCISEPDKGQAEAINKGLIRATGQIIAYLNSDDVYKPKAFQTVVDYFNKHPDTTIIAGQASEINAEGKQIGRYPVKPMNWTQPQPTCSICQPAVFWRRDVYKTIGDFDESLHYVMDYEYWLKCTRKYKFTFIPFELAATRYHSQTKTNNSQAKVAEEMISVQKKFYGKANEEWILHRLSQNLIINRAMIGSKNYFIKMFWYGFLNIAKTNRTLPTLLSVKKLFNWLRQVY